MKEPSLSIQDPYFTAFPVSVEAHPLPVFFSSYTPQSPHPLCVMAAEQVQAHLQQQKEWVHDFGLSDEPSALAVGKMFGVLVVLNSQEELGYLSAFSGKLAGGNHHAKFVPPVFDMLLKGSFLNRGMEVLSRMNQELTRLEALGQEKQASLVELRAQRKLHSIQLQDQLFDQYSFLNQAGEEKSLRALFEHTASPKPPSGAGECAAPKLLHYAFRKKMKPLAMAEFWWGASPQSALRTHKSFYPACRDKCTPILAHMLAGIDGES